MVSATMQVYLPVAMPLPHRTKNGSLDKDELPLMEIGIVDVKVVSEAEKEKGEYGQEKVSVWFSLRPSEILFSFSSFV
ncbi:hypothetical protein PM082_004237 [Marasmius tenuissimus]|nr:hypothetical protein PM082_004237 [Marasmius tenuissimus]